MLVMTCAVILCLYLLYIVLREDQPGQDKGKLDYRHNGHYILDSVEEYNVLSRTDRMCHHSEGDAYKIDKNPHF